MSQTSHPVRDGVLATVIGGIVLGGLARLGEATVPYLSAASQSLASLMFFSLRVPVWALALSVLIVVTVLRIRARQETDATSRPSAHVEPSVQMDLMQPTSREIVDPLPQDRMWVRESPFEIVAHVEASPPLSRAAVAKEAYIGRSMRVEGVLRRITRGENYLSVIVEFARGQGMERETLDLFLYANESHVGVLSTLREGDRVRVTANVSKVNRRDIEADLGTIELSPEAV